LAIFLHGLCELLAYFLGFRYYLYLRKTSGDNLSADQRMTIFLAALLGAFLGSRLLAVWENYQLFHLSSEPWLFFISNKTILGGLLGGLISIELTKKMTHITTSIGDSMTYPIILGMIIGRIGCFFAGIADGTYGLPTQLPWGMDLGDGIKRHPTNLYEILFLS
jgi:phosphatidylglycerol:prolipoprotein diacylglycerol transferase